MEQSDNRFYREKQCDPKIITSEEFKERLDKLCSENKLANILVNGVNGKNALGFIGLSENLKVDSLRKMNLEKRVCPYSGATTYYNIN